MAIVGPSDLPYILKIDSDPIKKYVLSKLGFPSVEVEVTEDQWETILKTSGNFIAHYFSKEQMFGVFYTQPLESTYDLPNGAYWIQEVSWDPVTTMIDQIFGAESFLFCFADGMQVLREDGELVALSEWQPEFKAKTPYGPRKLVLERHEEPQELVEIVYEGGSIRCTPNHPIKIKDTSDMLNDWALASECLPGTVVVGADDVAAVTNLNWKIDKSSTTTIHAVGADCFYGCYSGKPILVH
jgi:hypothetical protein